MGGVTAFYILNWYPRVFLTPGDNYAFVLYITTRSICRILGIIMKYVNSLIEIFCVSYNVIKSKDFPNIMIGNIKLGILPSSMSKSMF